MLETVKLPEKSLDDYRPVVGDDVIDRLREQAKPLRGARVVHVNATAYGGGVAEILQTLVPLMRDVGLDAHWQVIEGTDAFFNVTKAMHNGLQGMDLPFTKEMQAVWERYNRINAKKFVDDFDLVVVHDPQPAGLCRFTEHQGDRRWIWRCHIDTSTPDARYWDFLAPLIADHPSSIFTMKQYIGPGIDAKTVTIIPPSIDPLSPKNTPMDAPEADAAVRGYGLDPQRPLLVQVSRFDPWKDPLGVIDAYREVKQAVPEAQLALVGSMAPDDPEGWDYYDRTLRRAGEDFDIRVLHNFHGVGNREVNAFQTAADVVIQKSTREGFGLVVTEALWKGKPVIGGRVGGIPLQIVDGQTGYLVDDAAGCAQRAIALLSNPTESKRMGQAAVEHVRQHFLSTRHLADYLTLFRTLKG